MLSQARFIKHEDNVDCLYVRVYGHQKHHYLLHELIEKNYLC